MNQFAAYATSTAFSVNLSKAMVNVLFLIGTEMHNKPYHHRRYQEIFEGETDLWTVAAKGLLRRGLVAHHEPKIIKSGPNKGYADYSAPAWTLTEAGGHVLELCKIAELMPTSKVINFRAKKAA